MVIVQVNPILIINTLCIVILTCILAYQIVGQIKLKNVTGYISSGIVSGLDKLNEKNEDRKLLREIKRSTRTISMDMTLAEKIELYLIDKSNIRRYIPFMSFYMLIIISLAIFMSSFTPVYKLLYFLPATAIICFIFSLIPYYILDIMGKYNSDTIRKRLAYFVSVLVKWYAVKEEIFYAFEKSIESGIGEPLKSFIRDMVIQINNGMNEIEALNLLQIKVDNEQFRDFVINIKHCVKRKGNVFILLNNYEEQLYKLEEELNKRNISTYKDRIIIIGVMLSVLAVAYYFLKTQPKVYEFYLGSIQGKLLLTLFTILYAVGFYLFISITKFKN